MRAAIVSLGSVSSKWTAEAMRNYFDSVEEIQLKNLEVYLGSDGAKILYEGRPLETFDCIFLKGSFRYVKILSSITSALEGKVYMPLMADAFTIGHDKLLTHLKLQQKNIPMPETYISATPLGAKKLLEKVSYPIVFKFPQGTQGKGVMFADSYSSALSIIDALQALNQPVIIQEYLETGGTDIRAIVVGKKVVAAMERCSADGDKRSNIHAGGSGRSIELDSVTRAIAVRTAEVIGAEICGVDILLSVDGPKVIEVNMSPGLQGVTKATGINVADIIAKHLYSESKKFVDGIVSFSDLSDLGVDDSSNSIIANLDIKAGKIILPKFVSEFSDLKNNDEILINVDKSSIWIAKSKISENKVIDKKTLNKVSTKKPEKIVKTSSTKTKSKK